MLVIPPIAITDALLISSSVVEVAAPLYVPGTTYTLNAEVSIAGIAGLMTVYRSLQNDNSGHPPASSPTWWVSRGDTYQAYSAGVTYPLGDRVNDNTNHIIYESLAAGNLNNPLSNEIKWLPVGPTNKWAMFDTLRNAPSIAPSSITVTIAPGVRFDAIALMGVVANSATISINSGGAVFYAQTIDLNTRETFDWYSHFFKVFGTRPSVALFDIPPVTDAQITVTLTATSGNVKLGALVLGSKVFIGDVQYEAESDIVNFSSVTRDTFGNNVMVRRRNIPKTIQNIWLDKPLVNVVRELRAALDQTPAVWSGIIDNTDGYFESLLILGFYKRFSINLKFVLHAVISLELEEI
jgi:hypothetical protein